jgi:hypothetical protein
MKKIYCLYQILIKTIRITLLFIKMMKIFKCKYYSENRKKKIRNLKIKTIGISFLFLIYMYIRFFN